GTVSAMPDADIHTLAAPYALHAIPDDEKVLFERHLDECAACRVEVAEIHETAARLGTAEHVPVPAEMKATVMARIGQTRRVPPVESEAVEPAGGREVTVVPVTVWRRWWPRVATGLVAALAALVIVLGGQLGDLREDLRRSDATAAQLRELVAAPNMEVVRAETNGSTGIVIMARSLDTAVLIAEGMAAPPPEHTYQLWFIAADGIRSAGLLGAPSDGQLGPFTALGLQDAARLGITVEPAAGSEQPTGELEMVIDLPA
ncbi:MAG: anti-sigma factor, partial [Jiangellaceae bacterium]